MKQADLFRHGITPTQMSNIQQELEDANKDDTPFVVASKEGISVVGDVNKTEIKKRDFSIDFWFDADEIEKFNVDKSEIKKWADGKALVTMEYEDVSIKPRYRLEVDAAIVKIYPYFYSVNEETKRIGKRSNEELIDLVNDMSIEIGDDMYNLVAAVLGIDRRIVNDMDWESVETAVERILTEFPEVANSSESSFQDSSARE